MTQRRLRGPLSGLIISFVGLMLLAFATAGRFGDKLKERSDGLSQISLEHKRRSVIANFPGIDPSWKQFIPQMLAPAVTVEPEVGLVEPGQKVTLTTTTGARIRYTLDGSLPDRFSPEYSASLILDSTVVLRARSFVNGKFPGDVATRTYLVNSPHELPILSVVTDPENMWNDYSGIYVKWGKRGENWRRKAVIEYFPATGVGALSFVADLRIHGGWSRQLPKKSFHLYFGRGTITGTARSSVLSAQGQIPKREAVIRTGGPLTNVRLNDALFQRTYEALGQPIGAIEPVAVYVNGGYFGAYNLRETVDADYAARHYNFSNPDVIEVDNCWLDNYAYFYPCFYPVAGDDRNWQSLVRTFNAANLANQDEFDAVAAIVDVGNFTDYWITNVFTANLDWPEANGYIMRNRDGQDTKWRWVPWDADQAFASYGDTSAVVNNLARTTTEQRPPNKPWVPMGRFTVTDIHTSNWKGTLFARKLLDNSGYRDAFVTRYADLLNTTFSVEQMSGRLEELVNDYSSEISRDLARWDQPETYFQEKLQLVKDFIEQRPTYAWRHLQERFGFSAPVELIVTTNKRNRGTLTVNTLSGLTFPFTGSYFREVDIELAAKPDDGFEFAGWIVNGTRISGREIILRLTLRGDSEVQALFVAIG